MALESKVLLYTGEVERELIEKYTPLFSAHEKLNREGERLVPLVLGHFNAYITETINPSLPKGTSITKSEHCFYDNGKFIVFTGLYKTPSGLTKGPLKSGTEVRQLLNEYQKKSPWIGEIRYRFRLSE